MVEETGAPGGNHRASGVKVGKTTSATGTRSRRDSGLQRTLEWSCNNDSLTITATAAPHISQQCHTERHTDTFSVFCNFDTNLPRQNSDTNCHVCCAHNNFIHDQI
jgi:hypothetical protein